MAMQESNNKQNNTDRKKRLVLGGRTYTIDDDDISVFSPANEKSNMKETHKNTKDSSMDPDTTYSKLNESTTEKNLSVVTPKDKDSHQR
jgi:hypothetical protein